jgi:mono/diheme cytochrome c family protein
LVADRTRLAKPDHVLLALIEQGNEARAMPAFGAILSPLQRQAVLAYLRSAFGAPAP